MKKLVFILVFLTISLSYSQELNISNNSNSLSALDSIIVKQIITNNKGLKDHMIFKTTKAVGMFIQHKHFKRYYVLDDKSKIVKVYDYLPNGDIIDIKI